MSPTTNSDFSRPNWFFLRHALATLAYRAVKVLRDVPEGFAEVRASPTSRTALEVLAHMGDLMDWGERFAQGEYRWEPVPTDEWDEAVERFFDGLARLDRAIAAGPPDDYPPEIVFQGPVADALTHVGQLALMRGLVGAPVRPESYARADIRVGNVGREQPPPGREFKGDASKPE